MIIIFFAAMVVVLVLPVTKVTSSPASSPTLSTKSDTQQYLTPTSASALSLDSQLSKHDNINDCWLKISGHFYDITSFFGSHPGGDQSMLPYCGRDATTAFATQGQPGGSPHSSNAQSLLQQYLIK